MVTRILFDPRRDLPGGTTQSNPVTIEATPTGIREDGQVVIYPTTISTPITTGADIFQLPANTASNGWRLTVRDTITSAVKQQRVVRVPDQASIAYQLLPDIDPASFTVTPGTARQWDATFWALIQAGAGGGLTDTGIAALIGNPASAVAVSLAATYLPFWKPNTAYLAGQRVVNPSGQTVTANTGFTSGASYDSTNWTIVAGGTGGAGTDLTIVDNGDGQTFTFNGGGGSGGSGGAVSSVAGRTGAVTLTKSDVGLGSVDNTPDASKPVSTAQAAADATVLAAANAKYTKPGSGIPSTDLATAAQTSLGKADTALQQAGADARYIRTVNGSGPDGAGNVTVTGGSGGTDANAARLTKLTSTISANGTLIAWRHNPVNAAAGAITATLPTLTSGDDGTMLSVEKTESSTNAVNITGNVRGVAATVLPLILLRQQLILLWDGVGLTWWPIGGQKTLSSLDARYDAAGLAAAAQAAAVQRSNHTGTQAATTITGLATVATSGSASDLGAGSLPLARIGTGTPAAGKYLDGAGAWTTLPAGGGAVAPRVPSPQGQNLKGWNFDPLMCVVAKGALQSGIMHWLRVPTPDSVSITNVVFPLAVAGASLTYAAVGIYSAATPSTLLAQSGDLISTFTGTAGLLTIPLTGGPYTVGGAGIADHIFVGIVAIGTTMPQLNLASSGDTSSTLAVMAGFTDGPRFGLVSAGSGLPASVANPASIGNPSNKNFWVAVS